jgi:hypothetical protein
MTSFRRILGVAILIAIPWTAYVWAEVPCFEDAKKVECPGAKPTGTCGDQFADFGINDGGAWKVNCNNGSMIDISTGIYKDSCLSLPVETGSRCEPKLDKNKLAVQAICATKYLCKYDKMKNLCVQGGYVSGSDVAAVVYELTPSNCRRVVVKTDEPKR